MDKKASSTYPGARRTKADGTSKRNNDLNANKDEDFYGNLAAQFSSEEAESSVSDADLQEMAGRLEGIDAMDDTLLSSLNWTSQSKNETENKKPPASQHQSQAESRVIITQTTSSTIKPSTSEEKENTSKPRPEPSVSKETEKMKKKSKPVAKKYDFGEFDEEDPLAGLLSDDDEDDSKPKAQKKPPPQKPAAKEAETAGLLSVPSEDSQGGKSPGSSPRNSQKNSPRSSPSPGRRKEEVEIGDDIDVLDSLGFDTSPRGERKPRERRSSSSEEKEKQTAKAKVDELFGRGNASRVLERPPTGERREFKLDSKYIKKERPTSEPKEPVKKEMKEEDFSFGGYLPSAAKGVTGTDGGGSPKRSVRFAESKEKSRANIPATLNDSMLPRPATGSNKVSDWLDEQDEPGRPPIKNPVPGDLGESYSTVKSATSSQADYLGLGEDIDLSSLVTGRPSSPPMRNVPAAEAGSSLFSPPLSRDTSSSPFPWDSPHGRRRPQDSSASSGSFTQKKEDASLEDDPLKSKFEGKRAEVVRPEVTTPAVSGSQPREQQQQQQQQQTSSRRAKPPVASRTDADVLRKQQEEVAGRLLEEETRRAQLQRQQQQEEWRRQEAQLQQRQLELAQRRQQEEELQATLRHQQQQQQLEVKQQLLQSQLQESSATKQYGLLQNTIATLEAKIERTEMEKDHLQAIIDGLKQRHGDEMKMAEETLKNRLKMVEEASGQRESRLRQENEELLVQYVNRTKLMEEEKDQLILSHHRKVLEFEDQKAREIEKVKDLQRLAVEDLKREHAEELERIKRVKNSEIDAMASTQAHTRSLRVVLDRMDANTQELGQLQHRVEQSHHSNLDTREIEARQKDEQLKTLKQRLEQQEEENSRERAKLQELIARMEGHMTEQTKQLEQEQWKVKREQARLESYQAATREEGQMAEEKLEAQRAQLRQAADKMAAEQKASMTQHFEERRALAAERAQVSSAQKLLLEKEQKSSSRQLQIEAEREGAMVSLAEEKAVLAAKTATLKEQQERLTYQKRVLENQGSEVEAEKAKLESLAERLRSRSAEVERMVLEASRAQEEGEKALQAAQASQDGQRERANSIQAQLALLRNTERRIAQDRLILAKEKSKLEHIRGSLKCSKCEDPLPYSLPIQSNIPLPSGMLNNVEHQPSTFHLSLTPGPTVADLTVDRAEKERQLQMWKLNADQDKQFLEEEKFFLEVLKSPIST